MEERRFTRKEKRSLIQMVEEAIAAVRESGQRVDFPAVAREVGVTRSTLYRNKTVRDMVSAAREDERMSSNLLSALRADIEALRARLEEVEKRLDEHMKK